MFDFKTMIGVITMKMKGRIFLEGDPWIDIKDSIEKLPGLFRDNYDGGKDFLYLLDLSSQDKFNELVVGVYDNYLYSMEKIDENVKIDKISYSDIEFMSKTEIMLMGRLDIISGDSKLTINYNTVSSDAIDNLIKKIRESYISGAKPAIGEELKKIEKNNFGLMFKTVISEFENQNENLFYLAFQDELNITPEEKKIEVDTSEVHLGGGIYASNGSEFLVIEKGEKFVKDEKDYHGFRISYIPFNKITSAELSPHKTFTKISQLVLNFSKQSYDYLFNRDNSEASKLVTYLKTNIK